KLTPKVLVNPRQRLRIAALAAVFLCAVHLISSPAADKPSTNHWIGYLIDITCARERKDKESSLGEDHTKKCLQMPVCDRSGFGILTDANQLLRFDEDGNRRARKLLEGTRRENKLRCVAWGRRSNDLLYVSRMELTRQ